MPEEEDSKTGKHQKREDEEKQSLRQPALPAGLLPAIRRHAVSTMGKNFLHLSGRAENLHSAVRRNAALTASPLRTMSLMPQCGMEICLLNYSDIDFWKNPSKVIGYARGFHPSLSDASAAQVLTRFRRGFCLMASLLFSSLSADSAERLFFARRKHAIKKPSMDSHERLLDSCARERIHPAPSRMEPGQAQNLCRMPTKTCCWSLPGAEVKAWKELSGPASIENCAFSS